MPLAGNLVALGEVGLAGELRALAGVARRLAEAARLGFTRAIVPRGSIEPGQEPEGMTVAEVTQLAEAVLHSSGRDPAAPRRGA